MRGCGGGGGGRHDTQTLPLRPREINYGLRPRGGRGVSERRYSAHRPQWKSVARNESPRVNTGRHMAGARDSFWLEERSAGASRRRPSLRVTSATRCIRGGRASPWRKPSVAPVRREATLLHGGGRTEMDVSVYKNPIARPRRAGAILRPMRPFRGY